MVFVFSFSFELKSLVSSSYHTSARHRSKFSCAALDFDSSKVLHVLTRYLILLSCSAAGISVPYVFGGHVAVREMGASGR